MQNILRDEAHLADVIEPLGDIGVSHLAGSGEHCVIRGNGSDPPALNNIRYEFTFHNPHLRLLIVLII